MKITVKLGAPLSTVIGTAQVSLTVPEGTSAGQVLDELHSHYPRFAAGLRGEGLPRALAHIMAVQTVLGTARLCHEEELHPALLKDLVTSPGGTTIAGIYALESSGFRGAVMDAVTAAATRSQELGEGK